MHFPLNQILLASLLSGWAVYTSMKPNRTNLTTHILVQAYLTSSSDSFDKRGFTNHWPIRTKFSCNKHLKNETENLSFFI